MNDLTFDGVTQSVCEWGLDYGIPPRMITNRIRSGWTVEEAITKPMPAKPGAELDEYDFREPRGIHRLVHNGQSRTLAEWAKALGIQHATLYQRIREGWTVETALNTPLVSKNGPQTRFRRSG
ncbi:MAG: hypothetical protein ACK40W_02610 [Allorhizobium sp.]